MGRNDSRAHHRRYVTIRTPSHLTVLRTVVFTCRQLCALPRPNGGHSHRGNGVYSGPVNNGPFISLRPRGRRIRNHRRSYQKRFRCRDKESRVRGILSYQAHRLILRGDKPKFLFYRVSQRSTRASSQNWTYHGDNAGRPRF